MLNKQKIGKFIKENRKSKGLTQQELLDLVNSYINDEKDKIENNMVSLWERGLNIPEVQCLQSLSIIFEVSIDEILNGELDRKDLFKDKYLLFCSNPMEQAEKQHLDLYDFHQSNVLKVLENFNLFIDEFIDDELSSNHEKELEFIIDNFYSINSYFSYNENCSSNYLKFKFYIGSIKTDYECLNKYEKKFLIKNLLLPNKELTESYLLLCEKIVKKDKYIEKKFDLLEPWEKDIYFSLVQKIDPCNKIDERGGLKGIKRHEQETGEIYDEENERKTVIRFFINHGCSINKSYLNYKIISHETKRRIDRIEQIYKKTKIAFKKIRKDENNVLHYYQIENTNKNMFLETYYFLLNNQLGFNPNQLYDLFLENDLPPKEYKDKLIEIYKIDKNLTQPYLDAEIERKSCGRLKQWIKLKEDFNKYLDSKVEYKKHLKFIKEGNYLYEDIIPFEVGGLNENDMMKYRLNINCSSTYKNYKYNRQIEKTNELLNSLDALSYKQIKEKFFPIKEVNKYE